MEKSRPKRLLGLIKRKADSKPPEAPSSSAVKSPAKDSSAKPQSTTKELTGKASDTPVGVPSQTPGAVQQTSVGKDEEAVATPSKPPQPDSKGAGGGVVSTKKPEPSLAAKDESAAPAPAPERTEPAIIKPVSDSSSSSAAPAKDVPPRISEEPPVAKKPAPPPPPQLSRTEDVGEQQPPRLPVRPTETQPKGATAGPADSHKAEAKPVPPSEAPAGTIQQPPEDKTPVNLMRYQALVDITSDYVFLITRDGRIEGLGPSGSRQAHSDGDVPGKQADVEESPIAAAMPGVAGMVASSLIEHGKQYLNRAREEKAVQRFTFNSTIGGRLCHFRARLTATEQGKILAVVRDSTDETLLNSSLTQVETYRTLLDKTVDGLLVVDVKTGIIQTCNESAASQFACRAATELVGMGFVDFVSEEDKERITRVVKDPVCDLNSGQTLEFRAVRKDGVEIWVRAGISSADWNGALARLISTTDVTELKRTEDALRLSEERFHGLVQSTHDWVWEINTEGEYTYASPKVTDILGYDPEEVLGKTPLDFMNREEAERIVNDLVSVLSAREPFDGLRVVCLHKDGHTVSISKSGVPFFGKEGRLLGYRGIDRDISNGAAVRAGATAGGSPSMINGMIQVIISIMETRDRYTAMHQQYVARLAADIATELGFTEDQVQSVRIAGLMHDLGKMCIPLEILNKPGQLSRLESDIMKGHPRAGYEILKNVEFPWPIGQMILQHHERMNGSGYPSGLRGDEILLEARILAVADVVVAMSSHRPYRPAQSLEKALREILENRGTLYDSVVVDACLSLASRKGFSFQEKSVTPAPSPIEYGVASGCAGLSFGI